MTPRGLAITSPDLTHNSEPSAGDEGKRNEDGGIPPDVFYRRANRVLVREFWRLILRKEVIQPQVPLRLPCYDFTPVADPTVVACLPYGLAQRLRVKPTPMV